MNGGDEQQWKIINETHDAVIRIEQMLSNYDQVSDAAFEGRNTARQLMRDLTALSARFWAVILGVIGLAVAVLKDWVGGG